MLTLTQSAQIDHFVVATRDLAAGARWLEHKLGATLAPAGTYTATGTHNRLPRLAGRPTRHLELIAIDPTDAPAPPTSPPSHSS
jgi:hypothetical protein